MGTGKKLVLASLVSTMMVLAFAIGLLPTLDTLGVTASDGSTLDWSKLYRIMSGDSGGKVVTAVDITVPPNDGTVANVVVLEGSTTALMPVAADVTPAGATVRFGVDGNVSGNVWNGTRIDTTVGGVQVVDIGGLGGAHSLYALAVDQTGKATLQYELFDRITLNIQSVPGEGPFNPFTDLGDGENFFEFDQIDNRTTVIQDLAVLSAAKAIYGEPLGLVTVPIQQDGVTLTVQSASLADYQTALDGNGMPFIDTAPATDAVLVVQYAPTLAGLNLGNPGDLGPLPTSAKTSAFGLGFIQIAIIYSTDGGATAVQLLGLPATLPVGIRLQGLTLAKAFDPSVTSGAGIWSHPSGPFDNTEAFSTSFTVPQGADWRKRTGSTLDTFNSILEIYVDYLSIFAPLDTQFSITSVTPPAGAASGGTPVTINGSFPVASAIADAGAAAAAYAVYFGDPSASTLAQFNIAKGGIAIDSTTANVLTPDSGLITDTTVGVWIVDRNATSDFASLADAFTFIGPPSSGGPVPNKGSVDGGTVVTFTGTNLATTSQVLFGSISIAPDSATATTVTATTPPADNGLPGTVTITIITDGGSATAGQFEYVATPFISSFTPTKGVRTVQTTITVSGAELSNVISVTVAGISAVSFTEINSGTLEVVADTSPDVRSGPIVVTTAGGTATSAENFNYLTDFNPTPPIIDTVSPDNGWVFGGMVVEIAGTGFTPQNAPKVNREDVTVTFGTYTAAVLSVTDTVIYVLAPEATNVGLPDASRTVDVTVSRNDDSGLSGTLPGGFTFVKFIQRAGEDWTTTASKLGANNTISVVLGGDSSQVATVEVSANTEGVKFNTDVFVLARAAMTPDGFGLTPPAADAGSNVTDSFTYFDVHTYVLDPAFNTQPAGIDTGNLSGGLNILDENTGSYDSVAQKDSLLSTPIGSTNITTAEQTTGQVTIFGDRIGAAKTPTTLTYVWPDANIAFGAGDSEVYWSTILNGEFTAAGDSLASIDNGRLRGLGTFVVRGQTTINLEDLGVTISPESPTDGDIGTAYNITVVSEDGGLGFLNNPRFGNNAKAISGGIGGLVDANGANEFQRVISTPTGGVPVNTPVDIGLFLASNSGDEPDLVFQNAFTFNEDKKINLLPLILAAALALLGLAGGDGGGGGGGPCFIATAAYGTPMADDIDALRAVRDTYLLDNAVGAAFVDTYYTVSPAIADVVASNPVLAAVVRIALVPVIWMSKLVIAQPTLAMALALLMGALALGRKARRNKA